MKYFLIIWLAIPGEAGGVVVPGSMQNLGSVGGYEACEHSFDSYKKKHPDAHMHHMCSEYNLKTPVVTKTAGINV